MLERLWVYMGYAVHALVAPTGDGLFSIRRIVLQRAGAYARVDIGSPSTGDMPQSRPEDALNDAYACACKAIDWIASTDARN